MLKNYTWIPFFVTAIDQMTKRLATQWGQEYIYWTSFLQGKVIWNTGISFGFFANSYHNILMRTIIWICLMLVVIAWIRAKSTQDVIGWGLVVGGGISNIWDRWVFGAVLDFIDLHIADYHFPAVFNVADIAISLGALVLLRGFFFTSKPKRNIKGEQ